MFGCCSDGTDQETAKRLRDEQTLEGSFEENSRLQNHILALEHTLLELVREKEKLIREKEKLKLENVSFTEKVVTLYQEKSDFETTIKERDELIKTLQEESKFRSHANSTTSRDMTTPQSATDLTELQARYDQFEKEHQQYISQQQQYISRIAEQAQTIASLQAQVLERDRVIASTSEMMNAQHQQQQQQQQPLNKMDHLRAFFSPPNPPKSPGRPKSSRSPR